MIRSFRSYLFRSYSLVIFINSILVFILLNLYLQHYIHTRAEQELNRSLSHVIDILKPSQSVRELSHYITQLAELTTNRMTIIDATGHVLVDSHEDVALMDNHIDRPEIQSLNQGPSSFS